MGILDELFRRKPEDEFLPEYARPADPLRQLRDAIPENKDGGLSMLNMIRSALGTSANWLDGTKDPSLVGPAEMVSPLGLLPMGSAGRAATAAAKPAQKTWYHGTTKDFEKFDTPEVYFSSNPKDAGAYGGAPTSWRPEQVEGGRVIPAHVKSDNPLRYDGGELFKGSPPQAVIDDLIKEARAKGNDSVVVKVPGYSDEFYQAPAREHMIAIKPGTVTSATSGARLFADNAKGSAPGLAANSTQQQESGGIGDFLHRNFVDATVPLSSDENEWAQEIMGSKQLAREDRLRAAGEFGKSAGETISGWFDYLPQEQARKGLRHLFEKYGTGGPIEPVTPEQQTPSGPMLMELLRRLEEGA